MVEDLGDSLRPNALRRDFDLLRVVHVLVRELHDRCGQSGGKEEGLAAVVGRTATEDFPQVPDESHVEHPVGLVDHEDLDVPERRGALLLVVDQASRRPDEQIGNGFHGVPLESVVESAEHGERG